MKRIVTITAGLTLSLCTCVFAQQGATSPAPTSPTSSTPAATKPVTSRPPARPKKAAAKTQVIGIETAPPTPSTSPLAASETPAQRAADQQLLQQQQAQQAQAAAVNAQQVQHLQQQEQQVQQEVRIQDAPGPSQTGVVPAAGTPVAPTNADDRIQDAPGPAQTLPAVPAPAANQASPNPAPAASPQI